MMAFPRLGSSVGIAVPVVMSVALLAGCGSSGPSEPNADQVANMLLDQISKMIVATTVTNTKVTDDLFDRYVSCGNGKVKITYSVSGTPTTYATSAAVANTEIKRTATPKQIIDDLMRFAPQVGDFTVTARAADGATVKLVDASTRTRLTLNSPGNNRLVVSGETYCLRAGNLNRWPSSTPKPTER
jgi:predicted small lipoprotein YifL